VRARPPSRNLPARQLRARRYGLAGVDLDLDLPPPGPDALDHEPDPCPGQPDVGSHPEYAAPKCDSLIDLVTHDKAGERILEGLLVDADRRLREEGIAGDIYLFKNNTDSAGNSCGYRDNYLVPADILIPFLVTRQIILGRCALSTTARFPQVRAI